MRNYIIYCDESVQKGEHCSNFYGGAILEECNFDKINDKLNQVKKDINLNGELKWSNVSAQTLEQYKTFVDEYFKLMEEKILKVRIMFTREYYKPIGLTEEQKSNQFYLLYYQFIKNAFGLQYHTHNFDSLNLKIYFDKLPKTKTENERFKDYIYELQYCNSFKQANINISTDNITDVNSKSHVILQGMDIILGSMNFKLNCKCDEKIAGTSRRGKKTIAKEKLYKHINKHIQHVHGRIFNIGISTGKLNGHTDYWNDPYRHWCFISSEFEIDKSKSKKNKKIKPHII